ncbi:MAG: phosphate ABC transporter permease PstA [Polyangiaceae bacterium]
MSSYSSRRLVDRVVRGMCLGATILAFVPLVSILLFVGREGIKGLSWSFFTHLPTPVGEPGGGVANAIVGTLTIVALACTMAIPAGILAGVYLNEFGGGKLARLVRFVADVLAGVPSIVVGMFVYAIVVIPMKRQSAIAGSIALAILMLPTITRTTEELLKLVPNALREAALALGVPRWRAILRVVVRTALPGIATGIVLAVARATGETAPLLFTSANNQHWADGIDQPTASLTVQIFQYSVSPYDDWHQQAWAAALVLILFVLVMNVIARVLVRHRVSR